MRMADEALAQMFEKDEVYLPHYFADHHGAVRVKRCPPSMSMIKRDMTLPATQKKTSEVEKAQPEENQGDE